MLFDRTPGQWRELGAPAWVFDPNAAAEAYTGWASPSFGGGQDPNDPALRLYYVGMIWTPRCVKPQWLSVQDALTDTEVELLATDRAERWGRPGRCRGRLLAPDAPVPAWLECCRMDTRHVPT